MALTQSELEQATRNREADVFNAARRRRMESHDLTVMADPNRFSPFEVKAVKERLDQQGLRAHELAMAQKDSDTKLGVAEKNAFGMQHQGEFAAQHNADAARYRADQDVKIADITQKGLTEREKAIAAGNLEVEKTRQAGAKSVAETQGEWNVKQQSEANKGLIAKTEYEWQQKEKQIAADIQKRTIAAGSKVDAAKVAGHAKIISDALKAGALSSKHASTVLAELAEANKNNPELLASITAFAGQNTTPPPGTNGTQPYHNQFRRN